MNKFYMILLSCLVLFISGCKGNISNIDIQKLNQKASEYMAAGEYDKAVARLESILDLSPDYVETYYNLGVAYYQMNDYEKAIANLNTAISKKEDFSDAYYSRAVVYEDFAYSLIEPEDTEKQKTVSDKDKETSLEYLKNAKADFEKYIELKPTANDKDEVNEKIMQIDNHLSDNNNDKDE